MNWTFCDFFFYNNCFVPDHHAKFDFQIVHVFCSLYPEILFWPGILDLQISAHFKLFFDLCLGALFNTKAYKRFGLSYNLKNMMDNLQAKIDRWNYLRDVCWYTYLPDKTFLWYNFLFFTRNFNFIFEYPFIVVSDES